MLTVEQKNKKHKELLDKLHELYLTKNSDYGDSVHQTFKKYGMTSYLVRVEDKLNRVHTLTERGFQAVNDEKVLDSLLDAANYLILAAIELEEDKSERVIAVSLGDKVNSSISYGYNKGILSTTDTAKLSSIVVRDDKVVSYDEREVEYKDNGGVSIYEHRPSVDKANGENS